MHLPVIALGRISPNFAGRFASVNRVYLHRSGTRTSGCDGTRLHGQCAMGALRPLGQRR